MDSLSPADPDRARAHLSGLSAGRPGPGLPGSGAPPWEVAGLGARIAALADELDGVGAYLHSLAEPEPVVAPTAVAKHLAEVQAELRRAAEELPGS